MAALAELDQSIEALRQLKPPGVSKSRVGSITALFIQNVQLEQVLVERIVNHLKISSSNYKLGILYVIDAVVRAWLEHANKLAQSLNGHASSNGSFAAGVKHITESLPSMMNDIISSAPDDQQGKILKLIDIWLEGKVFPASTELLSVYKNHLQSKVSSDPGLSISNGSTANSHTGVPVPNLADIGSQASSNTLQAADHAPGFTTNGKTTGMAIEPISSSFPGASETSPQSTTGSPSNAQALVTYMQWLQELSQRGVPSEEWPAVLAVLQEQARTNTRTSVEDPKRHSRDRSRSPRRRPSPVYEPYNGKPYRSRTPERDNTPSKQEDKILLGDQHNYEGPPKWTAIDPTIPRNHIKVLSRTLFVGGNSYAEQELRELFGRFGQVQSCVPNVSKKHAFVKMVSHEQAVQAKEAMAKIQDPNILKHLRQTKWGVGFGPRECCNYDEGYSVIPIESLTEADKRWVLTAEYGGTGGKPISTGMVMEEPDIEIGAGVSSKAISKRPGVSSPAPRSSRQQTRQAFRSNRRPDSHPRAPQLPPQPLPTSVSRPIRLPESFESNTIGVPPAVPGFGFQLPGTFM